MLGEGGLLVWALNCDGKRLDKLCCMLYVFVSCFFLYCLENHEGGLHVCVCTSRWRFLSFFLGCKM